MNDALNMKHYRWRWVYSRNGEIFYRTWINQDGSLHNPNGYPEEVARAAALWADEQKHQKLIEGRKRGVETAKRRREQRIAKITRDFLFGKHIGNLSHCAICSKALGDPTSISRGIGSECWPRLMDRLAQAVPNCEHRLSALQAQLRLLQGLNYEAWKEKHGSRDAARHDWYFSIYSREKADTIRRLEHDIADQELLLAAARRWEAINV
jgi:hypothetical protein